MPTNKTRKSEFILCAAIWVNDGVKHHQQCRNIETGYVVGGCGHVNCIHTILSATGYRSMGELGMHVQYAIDENQGFITSHNRFVDRKEGGKIAFEAGQISKPTKFLFSEDILYEYQTQTIKEENMGDLKDQSKYTYKSSLEIFEDLKNIIKSKYIIKEDFDILSCDFDKMNYQNPYPGADVKICFKNSPNSCINIRL